LLSNSEFVTVNKLTCVKPIGPTSVIRDLYFRVTFY